MRMRPARSLLVLLAAACTSQDATVEGQGNAVAGRIDALASPLREGRIADSLARDIVSLRDGSKGLATTEIARLPRVRSGAKAALSSIGRDLHDLGGSLPTLASFLALPSRPLLRDPRDAEPPPSGVPLSRASSDSSAGGSLLGNLLKKLGF